MKINKLLFSALIIIFLFSSVEIFSQECKAYFPAEIGTTLKYENYNHKDKLQGSSVQKLVSVDLVDDTTFYRIEQELYDKKDKLEHEGELTFKCHDNKFYFDMSSYVDPKQFQAYENMEMEMSMDNFSLPEKLSPGMELDEGFIKMSIDAQMMKMNFDTRVFNRKVEALENLTTPAGTFEAYRISSEIETKSPMMTITLKIITWYSEEIGMIKTENYNKKGKLDFYTVLTEIQQ